MVPTSRRLESIKFIKLDSFSSIYVASEKPALFLVFHSVNHNRLFRITNKNNG